METLSLSNDYRITYPTIDTTKPISIQWLASHFRRRYVQRFDEEFQGSFGNTYEVLADVVNYGLNNREMYEYVDWFVSWIMRSGIPSINLMKKKSVIDYFRKFKKQNIHTLRYGEDWYGYCRRLKKIEKNTPLDDILIKLCKNLPKRRIQV